MHFHIGVLFIIYFLAKSCHGYDYNSKQPKPGQYCLLGNDETCGTNGYENFLFDNQCEFNDFNHKQLEAGQLVLNKIPLNNCYGSTPQPSYNPSSYCPQYCNLIFRPVCGSFMNVQRNFSNECELRKHICETKENWQIILNGTCVSASCPLQGQEVCASFENQRQTFPNLLSLYDNIRTTGKNWQILNVGPCPCPTDYRPICAKLNCTTATFQNECFLQQQIKNGNLWSILFYGECPILPTTPPSNDNAAGNSGTANTLPSFNANNTANSNATATTPPDVNATTTISPTTLSGNGTTNNSPVTPLSTSSTTARPPSPPPPPPGSVIFGILGSATALPNFNLPSSPNNRPVYRVKQNKIVPYGNASPLQPTYRPPATYERKTYVTNKAVIPSHNVNCSGDKTEYSLSYNGAGEGVYNKPDTANYPSKDKSEYSLSYNGAGEGVYNKPVNTNYPQKDKSDKSCSGDKTEYSLSYNRAEEGVYYKPATTNYPSRDKSEYSLSNNRAGEGVYDKPTNTRYPTIYSRSEKYPNNVNRNTQVQGRYSRPRSGTNNYSYSNAYNSNAYHSRSSSYTKSNYKTEYSVKYIPIKYGGNNGRDHSYEVGYDAVYESFT